MDTGTHTNTRADSIIQEEVTPETGDTPPVFGRCPVCGKPLRPRDKRTGAPAAPKPGTGYESRARCSGCGTILVYLGGGRWRPLTEDDLTDDDRFADSIGLD